MYTTKTNVQLTPKGLKNAKSVVIAKTGIAVRYAKGQIAFPEPAGMGKLVEYCLDKDIPIFIADKGKERPVTAKSIAAFVTTLVDSLATVAADTLANSTFATPNAQTYDVYRDDKRIVGGYTSIREAEAAADKWLANGFEGNWNVRPH